MTDYLESISQENERALLELERRLERALSGVRNMAPGEDTGEGLAERPGEEHTAFGEHPASVSPAADIGATGAPGGDAWQWGEGLRGGMETQGTAETAEHPSPLLDELQRIERAARYGLDAGVEGHSTTLRKEIEKPGRGRGGWRAALPENGVQSAADMPGQAGWSGPNGLDRRRGGIQAGGALDWAEQADRVFRRDSRRYDGGFYLY